MGKNLLVDRCLQAFQDELRYAKYSPVTAENNAGANRDAAPKMFRVVHVHGVLIPGHDVNLVVREMLQQLSRVAFEEATQGDVEGREQFNGKDTNGKRESSGGTEDYPLPPPSRIANGEEAAIKRQKRQLVDRRGLRLRMSTFDSNLQLLGETLKIARVDQIPILIVLDEVDAFLGGSSAVSCSGGSINISNPSLLQTTTAGGRDRQLLLYHLLDRVATQGSNVCLIGLTQHLTLRSKLEKRIKSRMEGEQSKEES